MEYLIGLVVAAYATYEFILTGPHWVVRVER
jgi:hypothetical protein